MKERFSHIILIALAVMLSSSLSATHNRAGEITYKQTGPLTIEMTIITYTKASSVAADRDSLDVFWGDGTHQQVRRDNSRTRFEPNDIKINYYIASHTYPGVATYTISFIDPNRIGGILNVNYPNSIDIPFFLSTTFTLLDPQFQGYNNSAILLQPPIDIGCVNKVFIHNPNAYDPDGDSLAFELAVPLQDINTPVPGYKYPDQVGVSSGNDISINSRTGEVIWDSPKLQGEYNIAIRIKEYRNGRLINVILRDMQILIKACDNDPPTITSEDELCVVAGENIIIPVQVNDPNPRQKVRLSATGGAFSVQHPAILNGPVFFTNPPFNATITWQTNCNHISDQYYQIVLRAVDNFYSDSTGLATLKTIRIKVVGPAPKNLTSEAVGSQVQLSWDAPYSCEQTDNNYFQGFSVWRKIASTVYEQDTCSPGLTSGPYTKISFKTQNLDGDHYTYFDNTAEKGKTYCYRVQAEFAQLTATGNPFNKVESLASNETCITLSRDLPIITKVSVQKTDDINGEIHLRWTKPLADQLDTLQNPGPYTYIIERSTDGVIYSSIHEVQHQYFGEVTDTNYIDVGLNTVAVRYFYKVQLKTGNQNVFYAEPASSVFLTIRPTDKQNNLSWTYETPWANTQYKIYKQDNAGQFILIGTSDLPEFTDKNLSNDSTYCYKVETIGTFGIQNIEDPIINFSQVVCQQPIDNVPSCPVDIKVVNICDRLTGDVNTDDLYNTITWSNPDDLCPNQSGDIDKFILYYAETIDDELKKIQEIPASSSLLSVHYPKNGLLGCYAISSVDFAGNESDLSAIVCVDNCPYYELPNTFTPNGDGHNDFFTPRRSIFIAAVDFKVYNQWGNLVFETKDPKINWDGKTLGGRMLNDGTYYYTCRVFEQRVTGLVETEKPLSGFIHLIKN
ncbi:MAG: gliding motility-associated C-terminal domain-containing protein [Saprospiraceae bacterium]|nr:gliding motility-associated C-terminal domain-containing protein [Saprospiraceae bacterium]